MTLSDLRLKLAQLNRFLIENYLSATQPVENQRTYYHRFLEFFYSLNEALSGLGSALANIDTLSPRIAVPLMKALADATQVSYIIESAADLDGLEHTIKQLHSLHLSIAIEQITSYGKEFATDTQEADRELEELISDNGDYFNVDRSLKFAPLPVSTLEAAAFIAEHSTIGQVKIAFSKIPGLMEYFRSIQSAETLNGSGTLLPNLLNTLTIVLIAFGYVEPFFQVNNNISNHFSKLIKETSGIQASLLDKG